MEKMSGENLEKLQEILEFKYEVDELNNMEFLLNYLFDRKIDFEIITRCYYDIDEQCLKNYLCLDIFDDDDVIIWSSESGEYLMDALQRYIIEYKGLSNGK